MKLKSAIKLLMWKLVKVKLDRTNCRGQRGGDFNVLAWKKLKSNIFRLNLFIFHFQQHISYKFQ